MNKPLDPENIANENAFVENQVIASSDETPNQSEEKVEETPVDNVTVVEESSQEEAVAPAVNEILEEEVEEHLSDIESEEALDEEPEAKPIEIETPASKGGIIDALTTIVEKDVTEEIRNLVETLRQAFYKLKRNETEEAKKAFVENGDLEAEFTPEKDDLEEKLKELLSVFKGKKASLTALSEKQKEDNLEAKKSIIEKIKTLSENTDEDFYRIYNDFRKLQQEWKEIKQIPQSAINALWKEYQYYSEKFYDLLKINNEMRDYDFKKNLELKQALCEAVEKLDDEKDVVSAFYQLQKLHQDWREIGPVAKELREEIWDRFKKASSAVNKKHQEHFEALRNMEQRNLEDKTAICEELETLDYSKLASFKDWDEQNKRVLELQEKWKTIGYAPKKLNAKIFERFRAICDGFFQSKSNFYKTIKDSMEENLEKKKALCEKAEALKDNQDWKETTDKMIALQKEWKVIGPVSRKYSDVIWKRFISACDSFFEQKNKHFSSQKTEEQDNLKKKKEIITRINEIDESLPAGEVVSMIREIMTEWNTIGYVPFRDKDKIYKEYHTAIDKHFDRLKVDESERRLQSFKSNLSDISAKSEKTKSKLLNEREKLMRTYERLKSDIQTYENNIGFLSVSSKGGGGLVKEMNRKIETLKEELDLVVKKIELIDKNFDEPEEKG
jgi:Domain of Unknown Function (DUF349).